MKLAITDVSVLFDLFNVGVLPEFFGLNIEIYTTDFIYNEIKQSDEIKEFELFVRSGKLKIIVVEESEQETIADMNLKYTNRSIADKTAIYKAIQMDCILLTCDDKLKKEALDKRLEVHGSIWVIDQLIENGKLDGRRAIEAFVSLKMANAWLPLDEIDTRISNLKKQLEDK
jgi:PIN domain nuclease of toxin-antitoxin system